MITSLVISALLSKYKINVLVLCSLCRVVVFGLIWCSLRTVQVKFNVLVFFTKRRYKRLETVGIGSLHLGFLLSH